MLFLGETDAGDLSGVESFLLAVVPVAITAGAAVGGAAIQADAMKYAANQAKKQTVIESLAGLRALEIQANAETKQAALSQQTVQKGLDTGTVALLGLGALWLLKG